MERSRTSSHAFVITSDARADRSLWPPNLSIEVGEVPQRVVEVVLPERREREALPHPERDPMTLPLVIGAKGWQTGWRVALRYRLRNSRFNTTVATIDKMTEVAIGK